MSQQGLQLMTAMSSYDSGQGDSICTPKRAQKCLFNQPGGSSGKRNLMKALNALSNDDPDNASGDESDLGPMSPLALTDHSSTYDSSPGRHYDSPFTSPEKLSPRTSNDWDRLRPKIQSGDLTPFSHLKKTTRAARASPCRKIFDNKSPKSLPVTPKSKLINNIVIPATPEQIDVIMTDNTILNIDDADVIIPETPQKDDNIIETPKKHKYSEKRMKTPLGSISKSLITVPPLHRRKSLSALDNGETSSPERNLKRMHDYDNVHLAGNKFPKLDDSSLTVSKARASLFQDHNKSQDDSPKSNFTLSTKSFYSNKFDENTRHSSCFGWKKAEPVVKKRHSLPLQSNHHRRSGGAAKKSKFGGINGGVKHGIKRPKPKRHSIKNENKKLPIIETVKLPEIEAKKTGNDDVDDGKNENKIENIPIVMNKVVKSVEKIKIRPPSPVEDPNKRFFKTNRTIKSQNNATVTLREKVKVNVSDGKFALNTKRKPSTKFCYPSKKPRIEKLTFDTMDLSVDEPGFDTEIEKTNVNGILKVLEDDWGVDDYDTMKPLVNQSGIRSPLKAIAKSNVSMSPASVLSNMTSFMNIEDQGALNNDGNMSLDESKTYPLFAKGFKHIEDSTVEKKSLREVNRLAWQSSNKMSGGEKQYQLDAGQKRFGPTKCSECGVLYQMNVPEDENSHLIFHNGYKTLKFSGWKNEHVLMEDALKGSRVITIKKTDPKHCWKKVEEILDFVDRDLGLADMELTDYQDKKIYLYIRDKTVVGVLITEPIQEAHCMIPDVTEFNCCSLESTPAKCGVHVIWTAMSHRRQHIATDLLNSIRRYMLHSGCVVSLDDIAFSMPTPTGKLFAKNYTGLSNFKVYT